MTSFHDISPKAAHHKFVISTEAAHHKFVISTEAKRSGEIPAFRRTSNLLQGQPLNIADKP